MSATDETGAPFESDTLGDENDNLFLQHFLKNSDADKQPSDEDDEGNKQEPKRKPQAPKNDEVSDEPETDTEDEAADDDQPAEDEEEDEGDSEDDEGEDGKKKKKSEAKYAEDDVFVKVKIGDEEHQVSVKDLKRLYGQEASLTQKSMEVASKRKAVEDEFAKASLATNVLLQRARAAFEPYSKIDFLLASRQLSPEDYTALRNEAQAAYESVQFLEGHLGGLVDGIKQKQQSELATSAQASLKVLTGPVEQGGIEGFNEKLYDDIRAFAVKEGASPEVINQIVDPWAIRLIHDAMLFRRGKSKVITKKVNKTPKKVIKTTRSVDASKSGLKTDKTKQAMARLQKTGDADDAAEAFLARWAVNEDAE